MPNGPALSSVARLSLITHAMVCGLGYEDAASLVEKEISAATADGSAPQDADIDALAARIREEARSIAWGWNKQQ